MGECVKGKSLGVDLGDGVGEVADVGEVAKAFAIVEAVAEHKMVFDGEADVVEGDFDDLVGGLVEEGADANAAWGAGAHIFDEIVHREACIDDIFDDEDVFVVDGDGEVGGHANDAAAAGARAVAGEAKEIADAGQVDVANEVGEEGKDALEDADDGEIQTFVITGNLRAEAGASGLDVIDGEEGGDKGLVVGEVFYIGRFGGVGVGHAGGVLWRIF